MTSPHMKWAISGFSALILVLLLKDCGKELTPVVTSPMASNDALRVNVKDSRITVTTKQESETRYVPHNGSAQINLKDNGDVEIDVDEVGFTFDPGFGALCTNRLRLTADLQIAYWNRGELYIGAGMGPLTSPVIYIGLGYNLGQIKMDNTSLFIAFTTQKEIGLGIRVRL